MKICGCVKSVKVLQGWRCSQDLILRQSGCLNLYAGDILVGAMRAKRLHFIVIVPGRGFLATSFICEARATIRSSLRDLKGKALSFTKWRVLPVLSRTVTKSQRDDLMVKNRYESRVSKSRRDGLTIRTIEFKCVKWIFRTPNVERWMSKCVVEVEWHPCDVVQCFDYQSRETPNKTTTFDIQHWAFDILHCSIKKNHLQSQRDDLMVESVVAN